LQHNTPQSSAHVHALETTTSGVPDVDDPILPSATPPDEEIEHINNDYDVDF